MTPENFIYWINGLLEIGNPESLNKQQIQIIKDHINLVIEKKTPSIYQNPTGLASISCSVEKTLEEIIRYQSSGPTFYGFKPLYCNTRYC